MGGLWEGGPLLRVPGRIPNIRPIFFLDAVAQAL